MLARYLGLSITLLGSSLLIVATLSAIKIAKPPAKEDPLEGPPISDHLRRIEQSLDKLQATLLAEVDQINASYSQVQKDLQALREKVDASGRTVLDPRFGAKSGDELRTIETWLKNLESRLVSQDGKLERLDAEIAKLSQWAHIELESLAGIIRESYLELRTSLEKLDMKPNDSSQDRATADLDVRPQLKRIEDQLSNLAVKVNAVFERLKDFKQHYPRQISENGAAPTDCESKSERITIHFDVDSATLAPEATEELDALAQVLSRCGEFRLRVEGHTDTTGSESYNLALSWRRIEAVTRYLVSRDISQNRLIPVPVGESDPAATNATLEGRAINRRVILTLMRLRR